MPVDGDAIMGPDALRFGSRVFQRDPPLAEWILFQLGEQVMNLWGSADLCENANTRGQIAMAPDVINARVVGIMMLRLGKIDESPILDWATQTATDGSMLA
jgi:hypothetical protein